MQSDYKELVKLTSWRTGVNEQIYKDLCNFLFAKTAEEMKKPKNLIIRLRGVGSWFLRMKRLKIKIALYEEFHSPDWGQSIGVDGEEIPEIMKIFRDRLKDYEKYVEKRKLIKGLRNEYKANIQSSNREDKSKEES